MHNNCIFFKIKLVFSLSGPWRTFFLNNKRLYQEEREAINEVKSKELSEPFSAIIFLLDCSIQWFSSTFCAFLGISAKNELVLSCFCFIQKVVEMRLFFFEVGISCQGLTESANFLLWVRPIKLLLFIDELKVRAFLSALPKPSNSYTLCSLDTFKERH